MSNRNKMSLIRKKPSSRALFSKTFFKIKVNLKVLKNNFIFVGSARDEITEIPYELFDIDDPAKEKMKKIADSINPLNSTFILSQKPFIPGSTLKGMIRFRLEHSFKPGFNNKIYSCFIKQGRVGKKKYIRNFLEKFGYWPDIPSSRPKENQSQKVCHVCDLFGNSSLASRVIFSDANILNPVKLKEVKLKVRHGVDHKRVIPPNTEFEFNINLKNGTYEDFALLFIGMNQHEDGKLLLGMNKFSAQKDTKGNILHFGKIKLEIPEITQIDFEEDFTLSEFPFNPNDPDFAAFRNAIDGSIEDLRPYLRDFNKTQNRR